MRSGKKPKKDSGLVSVPLGQHVHAEFDREQALLCVSCRASGMTVRMLIDADIEANYVMHDGTLGVGAWMGLEVACSPEEAAELAAAIGPHALSSFQFIG
ncbi:hypothetical protein [Paraburkholderia caledonica]|uniref:hypothetical protein n=1 Tax=Paraburkholderia caledonica TaxID=134536 RepID=UPI000B3F6683|nr:hypothetical protein [Paraburkholderia caledonica]